MCSFFDVSFMECALFGMCSFMDVFLECAIFDWFRKRILYLEFNLSHESPCTPFQYAVFTLFTLCSVLFFACALFWNVPCFECATFGICPFRNVPLFGMCFFWNALFLKCALFWMYRFWSLLFLECALFGMCPFWNMHFLECALIGMCPFWNVPFLECALFDWFSNRTLNVPYLEFSLSRKS